MDAHDFTDKYVDVPVKGKDKEWRNYIINGVVEFSVGNDSFDYDYGSISATHELSDYVEDIDTDELRIKDITEEEEQDLDKCPEDLKEHLQENLFDLMKFSLT